MTTDLYQVGGLLEADSQSYVKREADTQLKKWVTEGEYCYVLTARQMGKSSLRVKIMKELQEDNIACATIDLTMIGTHNVKTEQWYGSLLRELVKIFQLENKCDLRIWLNERKMHTPVYWFTCFIEEVLLVNISQPIVIFIDEIDTILQLDFKEDFLALIRAFYKKPDQNQEYKRLTFVLIGVAAPYDLISDKKRTPWNIGQKVELQGFKLDEVEPLIKGLEGKVTDPKRVIQEILHWTGGQPFLTQKLCRLVCNYANEVTVGREAEWVKNLVRTRIIENWESKDEPVHLRTIQDRLLYSKISSQVLLNLYKKILRKEQVPADKSNSEQMQLLLSGLVRKEQAILVVYNRIYSLIFNEDWIHQKSLTPTSPKQGPLTQIFQGINLLPYFNKMFITYSRFRGNLGKEPLKDWQGVAVSDVVKDEVIFKILNWQQWTLLFSKATDGKIILTESKGVMNKLSRRVKSDIPTKSDDFYEVFDKTVKELENFARDCIKEAVRSLLTKLSNEIAKEIEHFQRILHEDTDIEENSDTEKANAFSTVCRGYNPKEWEKFIIEEVFQEGVEIESAPIFPLARANKQNESGQFFDWALERSQTTSTTTNHLLLVQRLRDEITASVSLHLIEYVSKINKKVDKEILGILDKIVLALNELLTF